MANEIFVTRLFPAEYGNGCTIDPKLYVSENTLLPAGNIIFEWREVCIVRHHSFPVYRKFSIRSNWNVVLNAHQHGIFSSGTAKMWTESKELRYSDRGSNRSNRVTFDLRRNGDYHHTLPLTLRWDRRFLYINSDYVEVNKFESQTILSRHSKWKFNAKDCSWTIAPKALLSSDIQPQLIEIFKIKNTFFKYLNFR